VNIWFVFGGIILLIVVMMCDCVIVRESVLDGLLCMVVVMSYIIR